MTAFDATGFSEFDRLVELVRRTHATFDRLVAEGRLGPDGAGYLADATLPYLEEARGAFRSWLRAEMAGVPELRYLVVLDGVSAEPGTAAERAAAAMEAAVEERMRGGRRSPARLTPEEQRSITALAHARIVLGILPHVPDDEVRFPAAHRTYADIPVPRGPAELRERIEELERQVWQLAVNRAPRPHDPAFRRTYGFFDVAERLSHRGMRSH